MEEGRKHRDFVTLFFVTLFFPSFKLDHNFQTFLSSHLASHKYTRFAYGKYVDLKN